MRDEPFCTHAPSRATILSRRIEAGRGLDYNRRQYAWSMIDDTGRRAAIM